MIFQQLIDFCKQALGLTTPSKSLVSPEYVFYIPKTDYIIVRSTPRLMTDLEYINHLYRFECFYIGQL